MSYLKMPATVKFESIDGIETSYRVSNSPLISVKGTITVTEYYHVLDQIWEWIEDEGMNEYFNREGYKLIKKTQTESKI